MIDCFPLVAAPCQQPPLCHSLLLYRLKLYWAPLQKALLPFGALVGPCFEPPVTRKTLHQLMGHPHATPIITHATSGLVKQLP